MVKKQKALLISAIERHLGKHGPKDWAKVRDRFPDVPESTFWRIAKQVKERPASPEALTNARKRISARNRGAESAIPQAIPNVSVSLSPAVVAKHGDDAFNGFDFMKEVGELYEDAKQLRSFSVNGDGKIKNPIVFEKILSTAVELMERFYDIEQIQYFQDAIVAEIGAVDKETAHRIIDRLHSLNQKLGIWPTDRLRS